MPKSTLMSVEFHGTSLPLINHDGQACVPIKPICENVGLSWHAQRERIQRDPVLNEGARVIRIPSAGGVQEMTCLPLSMLNGWMFGVNASRVKNPAIREKLIEYQRECYDALHQYWVGKVSPYELQTPVPPQTILCFHFTYKGHTIRAVQRKGSPSFAMEDWLTALGYSKDYDIGEAMDAYYGADGAGWRPYRVDELEVEGEYQPVIDDHEVRALLYKRFGTNAHLDEFDRWMDDVVRQVFFAYESTNYVVDLRAAEAIRDAKEEAATQVALAKMIEEATPAKLAEAVNGAVTATWQGVPALPITPYDVSFPYPDGPPNCSIRVLWREEGMGFAVDDVLCALGLPKDYDVHTGAPEGSPSMEVFQGVQVLAIGYREVLRILKGHYGVPASKAIEVAFYNWVIKKVIPVFRSYASFKAAMSATGAQGIQPQLPPAVGVLPHVFRFPYGEHIIRGVQHKGSLWFVAQDWREALEYRMPASMLRGLSDMELSKEIVDGDLRPVVSMRGMKFIINRRSGPLINQYRFAEWMAHTVLPMVLTGSAVTSAVHPQIEGGANAALPPVVKASSPQEISSYDMNDLRDLCMHARVLEGWWDQYGTAISILNPEIAVGAQHHFEEGSFMAGILARRYGLDLMTRDAARRIPFFKIHQEA